MVGHHDELMQKKSTVLPAFNDSSDNDPRYFRNLEKGSVSPRFGGDKVSASRPGSVLQSAHGDLQGLKPLHLVLLCRS